MVSGALLLAVACAPLLQMLFPAYPRYGKGGVGLVSKSIYVHTKTKKNEALEFGTYRVLLSEAGGTPQPKLVAANEGATPVFLLFTQSAIYFYDFARFSGGNYLRGEDA